MQWTVEIPHSLQKELMRLPAPVQTRFSFLVKELELYGAIRGNWPNYSKLSATRHHCHVKKGKPCYVAVWEVMDRLIKLIEVQYVGTHESAPY